jgi:hypothetical protein
MPIAVIPVSSGTTRALLLSAQDMQDTWSPNATYLHHTKNIKSEISKVFSHLKVGVHYKMTFNLYDYVSCTLQVKIGENQYSDIFNSAGLKTIYFTVRSERDKTITFISDGIMKISQIRTYERTYTTTPIHFNNVGRFENKSWSISYNINTGWSGHHSYIPNFYFRNQNNFYALIDHRIWAFNSKDKFQTYFGIYAPFIVEYVSNSNPIVERIFEQFALHTIARLWDPNLKQWVERPEITFNKLQLYNQRQHSGELILLPKNSIGNSTWYANQTKNQTGTLPIDRTDNQWNINRFRDYVTDYSVPMFTSRWEDINSSYFIDKIPNSAAINFNKHWQQLKSLRDKYMIIRLKFDTFNDVNLLLKYSLETEQLSIS